MREIAGAWKPDQYSNPNNPRSHYETTGPEIWEQTDGRITHFVAGVGTGGTISGTGRYLKEVSDGRVQMIGADPEGSVYSGGTGRPYLVEGVGEDFWPSAYDRSVTDEIIAVSDARLVPDDPPARPRGGSARRRLLRHGGRRRAAGGRAACTPDDVVVVLLPDSRPRLPGQDLQRRVDGRLRLPRARRRRRDDGRRRAARQVRASVPTLVHMHPGRDRPRGDRHPARVRRLADAGRQGGAAGHGRRGRRLGQREGAARPLFAGHAPWPTRWSGTCPQPLPIVGAGEPVPAATAALEKSDALLVHDDGKPAGVLTRQDLLGFLANG